MDLNLKTYKRFKIKKYLKEKSCFFFLSGTSLNNENWINVEQTLVNNKLRYFRILNKIMINTLSNSVFSNLTLLVHGPILLLNSNNSNLTFKGLESVDPSMKLLGLRLNNRIYSKRQIKNLRKISYFESILVLHRSLKTFTKVPYYKFQSKKASLISK